MRHAEAVKFIAKCTASIIKLIFACTFDIFFWPYHDWG